MADKRMFTKKITDADEFISLPSSTQALYLHLCMSADDDGFNNQVQMSMFKAHASVDDLKILLSKRFILQFENGVIVIKHWRMANALRKDRYAQTNYKEELSRLKIKENGSYTLSDEGEEIPRLPDGCQMVAKRLPDGCQMVASEKGSIGKSSVGKESEGESREYTHDDNNYYIVPESTQSLSRRYGINNNVILTDREFEQLKLDYPNDYLNMIENLSVYMRHAGKMYPDHYATICKWAREDQQKEKRGETKAQREMEQFYKMAAEFGRSD